MSTKSRVLSSLENNRGKYISGANLAEECQVSRNAIWKAVNDLKNDGYQIESVNNRGYMLHEDSDIISEEGIRLYLKKISVKKYTTTYPVINVYEELDSTNTEAKRSLIYEEDRFLHGVVIISERQTAGRGHNGRDFNSPDGGIYMSIILNPAKMKKDERSLTKYIAETVMDTLQNALDIKLTLKDKGRIYQDRKKICGILTEGISDMETGEYSNYIVGIGILYSDIKHKEMMKRNQLVAKIIASFV
ncbi:BirA family transcriptional regulator, biotin operon repressor / biotin-[acetyl-CoA-carboxylase] ligase [Lachnospiraceae bacterium]|nr:BirA family transcriptional regulator, biotin operon repressor / biotin-[acetyl-CoA-carboxylase] ligase [Lachnospiraceae bacterium]